ERQCLGGILYGPRASRGLRTGAAVPLGFLNCKGLVEGILDLQRIGDTVAWSRETSTFLHPGRAAALVHGDKKLGMLGQIHPDVSDALGLPVFLLFELDFEGLLQYAPRRITARSLPPFPSLVPAFSILLHPPLPPQH